jgi:hypothetical protein
MDKLLPLIAYSHTTGDHDRDDNYHRSLPEKISSGNHRRRSIGQPLFYLPFSRLPGRGPGIVVAGFAEVAGGDAGGFSGLPLSPFPGQTRAQ